MKELFAYMKPYRRRLALAIAATAVSGVCDLLLPTLMSNILNDGIYRADFPYIARCCAVMLAVALIGLCAVIVGSRVSNEVIEGFCADLRRELFRKVNRMRFEDFGRLGSATLVTRATKDVDTVSWLAAVMTGAVVTIPVLFFGGVILAMRKDVLLSLVLLAVLPLVLAAVVGVSRKVGPLWERSEKGFDAQGDCMRQRLRGIRVIRAFNAEPREHARIAGVTETMSDAIVRANVAEGMIPLMAAFVLNAAAVLIVYFGGVRMESGGSLSAGDIFAVVQYVSLAASSVVEAAYAIVAIPRIREAARRIREVLHSESNADPIARQDLTLRGEIALEGVSFRYEGAAEAALSEVTLHIAAGQKAAVIGGTGAGKSTLVSLLLGFRMPTQGRILLDGMPTTQLSRYTMRENMRCVLQSAALYSGTIRENVAMGREGATEEEIRAALETAQAAQFVGGFSDGLDHPVSQAGKNLSGGQKQRICIARALLKDAPIYLFDDSFSALDYLTEANLRRALSARIAGSTQVIVTQRVSTAMHCDVIFVLDGGALVGSGTHDALLETCPIYREIYRSQMGGAS